MLVVRNQHILNQVNWLLVIRQMFVWISIAQKLFLDKSTLRIMDKQTFL